MFLKSSRGRIEERFASLCSERPDLFAEILEKLNACSPRTALAMKYLYGTMPLSDIGNYPFEIFLDYAEHGVFLWENFASVRGLSEEIFLNYVLYHRVNEEEIDVCRSEFYRAMAERVGGLNDNEGKNGLVGLDGRERILEVNYWCAEEATYQSTDDRTVSAKTVYNCGFGRCGEESTFCVNAMRSVGIPARQVYAPKWSHCDDNHAWVEVWHDGEWYFLGACEPEQILNKGWFTNASSRAMMVHSRWFDFVPSTEAVVGKEGMVTMLNQLPRYANTKTVEVTVVDGENHPMPDVEVVFDVLNYAEFSKIASVRTGDSGKAYLETGLGSLCIHTSVDDVCAGYSLYAEEIISVKETDKCVLRMVSADAELAQERGDLVQGWREFEFHAPKDAPVNTDMPTKEQKAENDRRTSYASKKCREKRDSFTPKSWKDFLYLSKKDSFDCKEEVLTEHLEYAKQYEKEVPAEIFEEYVLNPRVHDEVLTKYRKFISEYFSSAEREAFRKNPVKIWEYIEKHISEDSSKERDSLITTPVAALKLKFASKLSQKVLFVAIARTFGIGARINTEDGRVEYWKDGAFHSVVSQGEKTALLTLVRESEGDVWTYFQNWSIARMEADGYHSLDLRNLKWSNGELRLEMGAGQYRIITANRLPSGDIFAKALEFVISEGEEQQIPLSMYEADFDEMLVSLQLPEFELRDENGEEIPFASILKGKKTIVCFLEEGKEPTEHILNELMERSETFASYKDRIIFVVRDENALKDITLEKCLGALPDVRIYYDSFNELPEMLSRRMYVDPDKLPLVMVVDGENKGIYAASGYNVGTGDMLIKIME